MLTIEKVKASIETEIIQSARYRNETDAESKKAYKRHQRSVEHLRELEAILSMQPSEEYIRSEVKRHEDRIAKIHEGYETWKENNPKDRNNDNARAIYEKQMDIQSPRRHLKYAREILNG